MYIMFTVVGRGWSGIDAALFYANDVAFLVEFCKKLITTVTFVSDSICLRRIIQYHMGGPILPKFV